MSQSGALSRPLSLSGAFAAALTLTGMGGAADAQQISPLMSGLRNDVRLGPSSRYATPDGQLRFVFDRSGGRAALLRFEGDPEVHVLRPYAAAGGDELYRDESGELVLRVTPHGGIILYTRTIRTGAPVAEEGAVAPLTPQEFAIAQYQARMRQLQILMARAAGRAVVFQAPTQMNGPGAGVVLDAAERIAQSLAATPGIVVTHVTITIGPAPAARLQGGRLDVQVAPQLGYAGRPSSNAISAVVTGRAAGPEQ